MRRATDAARAGRPADGWSRPDVLAAGAAALVLGAMAWVPATWHRSIQQRQRCGENLHQVGRALLQYAADHKDTLPGPGGATSGDLWWWYKEQVKGYLGLTGPSSPADRVFACPADRGYSDSRPFWKSDRFDYGSYVYNGVVLPGLPNIAGWEVGAVKNPRRTLLVMEWCAHAPLSWHESRTGKANAPFYQDALGVVAFVDGHSSFSKMFYDGYSAAYTRDPVPGYDYQYSGR